MDLFAQQTISHIFVLHRVNFCSHNQSVREISLLGFDSEVIILPISKKEIQSILSLSDFLQRILADFSGKISSLALFLWDFYLFIFFAEGHIF